jgi:hypothetical protein
VVERVLREFLKCGLLEHGFARLWCSECRRSVLVAFSCRGRSFCPSCEKKKQLLWGEWLRDELLAPVPHRHLVLTIPRLLRPLFRRRRELLTELARAAAETTVELVRRKAGLDVRPGLVVSVATAGDLLQWHPHLHVLARDGGFSADGRFIPVVSWDTTLLMNRVRGMRQRDEAEPQEASAEAPPRRSSPSWARLIAKVYQVDPLVCSRCGQKMYVLAFLTDQLSIRRILDHLGLRPSEQTKPPPVHEILRVAEHGEGWGMPPGPHP